MEDPACPQLASDTIRDMARSEARMERPLSFGGPGVRLMESGSIVVPIVAMAGAHIKFGVFDESIEADPENDLNGRSAVC